MSLLCPACQSPTRVADSRPYGHGSGIWRRRECLANPAHRFSTLESHRQIDYHRRYLDLIGKLQPLIDQLPELQLIAQQGETDGPVQLDVQPHTPRTRRAKRGPSADGLATGAPGPAADVPAGGGSRSPRDPAARAPGSRPWRNIRFGKGLSFEPGEIRPARSPEGDHGPDPRPPYERFDPDGLDD